MRDPVAIQTGFALPTPPVHNGKCAATALSPVNPLPGD